MFSRFNRSISRGVLCDGRDVSLSPVMSELPSTYCYRPLTRRTLFESSAWDSGYIIVAARRTGTGHRSPKWKAKIRLKDGPSLSVGRTGPSLSVGRPGPSLGAGRFGLRWMGLHRGYSWLIASKMKATPARLPVDEDAICRTTRRRSPKGSASRRRPPGNMLASIKK